MEDAESPLADWLRDAHAVESQAVTLLETQINRLVDYPGVIPRLKQHLEETKNQREQLEHCLSKLGESSPTVKNATMKLSANMMGMAHAMASDEVLKHLLASHAFERFEAASYGSLAAAAKQAAEPEIAQACESIMQQELAMADWVWSQLQPTTLKYMHRSEAGLRASR